MKIGFPSFMSAYSLLAHHRLFLIAIMLSFAAPLGAWAAPPLPGGAQAGGNQPQKHAVRLPNPAQNLIKLKIPPVFERPLGTQSGPRVFVKHFVVTGVKNKLASGALPSKAAEKRAAKRFAKVKDLVERLRVKAEHLKHAGKFGFTPTERASILKFMQNAVKNGSKSGGIKRYRQLLARLKRRRLKRRAGLTVGQLQQIADAVTHFYRQHDYFLAHAVIPAQTIKNGVVKIRVLEGRLGKVVAQGNTRYSGAMIRAPFKSLVGQPLKVDAVENDLLTLTNYPGLSAFGVFRPGDKVGSSNLLIKVQQEQPFAADLRADNEGTQFTGSKRLLADVFWNNPTGAADLLKLSAIQTFSPSNNTFGDIRYEHPIIDPSDRLAVDISRNSFDVGGVFANANPGRVGGISDIATVSLTKSFQRTRTFSFAGGIDFSRKRADTQIFGAKFRDDLAVLGSELSFNALNADTATVWGGYLRYEHGFTGILGVPGAGAVRTGHVYPPPSRIGAGNRPATNEFNKMSLGFSGLATLTPNQSLLLRVNGQYSPDLLTSLEQFVIGGVDSVRAAPTSQFLTDTGIFGSLEYSIRAPGFADVHAFGNYTWGEILSFSVFTDSAIGLLNSPADPALRRMAASGQGVGVQFTVPNLLTLRAQYAWLDGGARHGPPGDPLAIPDATQFWLDLTASF
jgi:hemolysin activation/secretion protein